MGVFSAICLTILSALSAVVSRAEADLREGQKAILFESVDENLRHVDMAKMIDGRPLVLVVGSCS